MNINYVPSNWSRLIARLIDGVFILALMLLVLLTGEVDITEGKLHLSTLAGIYFLSVPFLYETLSVWISGTTIGKWVFSLKVALTKDPQAKIDFAHAILRAAAVQTYFFIGLAGPALALFRADRTHLADWIAQTRVITLRENSRKPRQRPILGTLVVLPCGVLALNMATVRLNAMSWDRTGLFIELKSSELRH